MICASIRDEDYQKAWKFSMLKLLADFLRDTLDILNVFCFLIQRFIVATDGNKYIIDIYCNAYVENINNVYITFSSRDTLDNFKLPVMIFFSTELLYSQLLVTDTLKVWLCNVTSQLSETRYTTQSLGQKKLLVEE